MRLIELGNFSNFIEIMARSNEKIADPWYRARPPRPT